MGGKAFRFRHLVRPIRLGGTLIETIGYRVIELFRRDKNVSRQFPAFIELIIDSSDDTKSNYFDQL